MGVSWIEHFLVPYNEGGRWFRLPGEGYPREPQRRGLCSSCGGWRMAEHAATLVNGLLRECRCASGCSRCRTPCAARCWGVYTGTLLAFYALIARAVGIPACQTGTVTAIQRFGSGLQSNLHVHTPALRSRGRSARRRSRDRPSCGRRFMAAAFIPDGAASAT